jgi:N-acetylmuramoyl-L-alanine amidase
MKRPLQKFLPLILLLLIFAVPARAFFIGPGDTSEDPLDVIVIDPGHGGDDSGAIGRGGVAEKEIALKVARRLALVLGTRLGADVLLTRNDDTFMTLEERVAFANRHDADVFISIHANSARNKKATGIETFFMSLEATDEDAMRIAEKENSVAGGSAGPGFTDDLKNILRDMAQSVTHHESARLAESVHMNMVKGTRRREDRGVKQAPFAVLYGALMPAVLVEVGFLSNPTEANRLLSPEYQARIADSIAEGVIGFAKVADRADKRIEIGKKPGKSVQQGL